MGHKPSITVDSPDIRAAQKRMALMTIVVPFAGTIAAAMLALKYGVGVMEISLLLSFYILTTIGIEVGFHRLFAHRAFETSTLMKVLLAILGSMAAEGSIVYSAAGHDDITSIAIPAMIRIRLISAISRVAMSL